MEYGDKFKRHRRYLQQFFHKQRLPEHYGLQVKEAQRLLNDFLDDPDNFSAHIKR